MKDSARRILFLQYTNPGAIPAIRNSVQFLAEEGWEVSALGVTSPEVGGLLLPPHPRVRSSVSKLGESRSMRRLGYLTYAWRVLVEVVRFRPRWIYASDNLSTPLALILQVVGRRRVIYHEHDSPNPKSRSIPQLELEAESWTTSLARRARSGLARRAIACVLPNKQRIELFLEDTRTSKPVYCVWNCPRRSDVVQELPTRERNSLVFHGVIARERLPLAVIRALADLPSAQLTVIGYETAGSRGYGAELRALADSLELGDRLEIRGPLPIHELLPQGAHHEVGLVWVPTRAQYVNLLMAVGASRKAFDYLASGLAILVPNLPDWEELFVAPGYGFSCDFEDQDALAETISRFFDDPKRTRQMGELGRERILLEWNFEEQFAPVLRNMELG